MRFVYTLFLALAVAAGFAMTPAHAGASDPLFINLSTDEAHRAAAGLTFGLHQQQGGHPLTLFLNDKGVLLGSKAHSGRYAAQQAMLAELLQQGATVLVAPLSMKHHGVSESDLMPGLQISNRKLTGEALFREHTRTLSW
jgi:sulfur relay (sulfurtransferase) complex TusBCD TusD component (DsrE family)